MLTPAKVSLALITATILGISAPSSAAPKCSKDMVESGSTCIDTYEASVWRIPEPLDTNELLVRKVKAGRATVDDLIDGGATLLGSAGDDYAPCTDNGQTCHSDIYAVSLPDVMPSGYITWFQAQQACKNSAKRFPTNAEWQAAVAGTPDGAPCNVASLLPVLTGASECVSSSGVHDMVGNMAEWVAEWVPRSTGCGTWVDGSGDFQCLLGAFLSDAPGALQRGGYAFPGIPTSSGPLAVNGSASPFDAGVHFGFRCGR